MEIKREINQEQEKIMSECVCSGATWTASPPQHKMPQAVEELRLAHFFVQRAVAHATALRLMAVALHRFTVRVNLILA